MLQRRIDVDTEFREFQNGPIYWSAASGAHPVVNHFFAAWARKGYEAGYIGYPTTDEIVNADGIGRRQEFQGAAIYWKLNEAYSIGGAIRSKWNTVGAETNGSLLGYPTSDEEILPDGQGRMNRFERGVLYWSPTTNAYPVTGMILSQWAAAGYERSRHGYPVADQTVLAGVATDQQFKNGRIYTPSIEIPIGATSYKLTLGLPSAVQLQPAAVTDGIKLAGPGFEVTFRPMGDSAIDVRFALTGPQSPTTVKMMLPLPPGYTMQSVPGRTNILAPNGSLAAAIGLPIAIGANNQLVPIQAQTSTNEITYQFGPSSSFPIRAFSDFATKNVADYTTAGPKQRERCRLEWMDCDASQSAVRVAQNYATRYYPGFQGDNRADALRHCVWMGLTTEKSNIGFAERIAQAHEEDAQGSPGSREMDEYNNLTGQHVGLRGENNPVPKTCWTLVRVAESWQLAVKRSSSTPACDSSHTSL